MRALRLSCSLAALTLALTACASRESAAPVPRSGSIKDTRVSAAPHPIVHKIPHAPRPQVERPAPAAPTPRRAHADHEPPLRIQVEPQPKAAEVVVPLPRASTDSAATASARIAPVTSDQVPSQPPRAAVVIKPVEAPAQVRPTADARRAAPDAPAAALRNAAVPAQQNELTASVQAPIRLAVGSPAVQAEPQTTAKLDPKAAALGREQLAASVLASADAYMKTGRYQNARLLLEDAARENDPRLLIALAETYDPLMLRDQYPKLVRTGDPEKAIAAYERARALGATSIEPRISALKTLAGNRP